MLALVQDQRQPTVDALVERAFATEMLRRREARGITQTRLAQEPVDRYGIKIDGTAITRIERRVHDKAGARAITLGEAVAIAAILGISIDELTTPSMARQLEDARRRVEAFQSQLHRAEAEYAGARREYEALQMISEQLDQQKHPQGATPDSLRLGTMLVERSRITQESLTLQEIQAHAKEQHLDVAYLLDNPVEAVDVHGVPAALMDQCLALREKYPRDPEGDLLERSQDAQRDLIITALREAGASPKDLTTTESELDIIFAGGDSRTKAVGRLSRRLRRVLGQDKKDQLMARVGAVGRSKRGPRGGGSDGDG
jgi:transcriptional regulator with XRE-family HTH domain